MRRELRRDRPKVVITYDEFYDESEDDGSEDEEDEE